ncbi:MAG: hypothetical protein DWQ05_00015 [Calditrichaeota bacterium]|nr:MAG: hypothetical protein DWQ05_00015 [Calditrichota bacterium]
MSQLIGYFSLDKTAARYSAFLTKIIPKPLYELEIPHFHLRCAGLPETCLYHQLDEHSGFVVTGLGLNLKAEKCVPLATEHWIEILNVNEPVLSHINGHFAIVLWDATHIRFFSDSLGLRTIYFRENGPGIHFSSRADWLNQMVDSTEINTNTFGSHWLAFNGLSCDQALTTNSKRLGQGGFATFDKSGLKIKNVPWEYKSTGDSNEMKLTQSLISTINIESIRQPSIGLSGGLDSRLLLSLTHKKDKSEFATHVFGVAAHPDVVISKKIADDFGLAHAHFPDINGDVDFVIDLAREYCCATNLIAPASTALRLGNYDQLNRHNKIMIDGGFGEIGRRQFLNRLKINLGNRLQHPDFTAVFRYFNLFRGNFFDTDFGHELQKSAIIELQNVWQEMPQIREIGIDNFLDLFSVRTRLPNYYAYEQARLDAIVPNFMPFAQPDIVELLLNLPVSQRQNSSLFRQMIAKNNAQLNSFPLVKGSTTYPFSYGTMAARTWTAVKTKLNLAFVDTLHIDFLLALQDYILGIIHSQSTKQYPFINLNYLKKCAADFYSGDISRANELDWWLAFEFWRQGNKIK